jgi:hypothetical protein
MINLTFISFWIDIGNFLNLIFKQPLENAIYLIMY